MKNTYQFPKVLGLFSLFLFLSPAAYAQSIPETDLSVTHSTQGTMLSATVKTKPPNAYECVRVEFDLYDRADRRPPGAQRKHFGVVSVEFPMRGYGEYSNWKRLPPEADWAETIKKSVTDCWDSAARQSVTLYENAKFAGRRMSFGVGKHTLHNFNNAASSIEVPTGLVAVVYEDADAGGGYGRYVDFLENQPELAKYNFDKTISHIEVFPSGRRWVRNALNNGRFEPGHSIGGKRWAPPNPNPLVGPAKPPNVATQPATRPPTQPPTPTVCSITGEVKNYKPQYGDTFQLTLHPLGKAFSTKVTGGRYTISNVPNGTYELRGSGFVRTGETAGGMPIGLGIYSDESTVVTCKDGSSNSPTFIIRSSEG